MAYSRNFALDAQPAPEVLTARLVGIGALFAAEPARDADIEQTLVHASLAGMENGDLRTLAVLTTWLQVHHVRVNVQRLVRLLEAVPVRTSAYWSAMGRVLGRDRRLSRLATEAPAERVDLVPATTEFLVRRRGEDERFEGTALRSAAGSLRDRVQDVMTEEQLVRHHRGYRNRVVLGATWRADVWSCLESTPHLTPADCARRVGCAFAVAWEAHRDWCLLARAGVKVGAGATATETGASR